jgi:hypothetical protein
LDGCDKILSSMDFKWVQYPCLSFLIMTLYADFTGPTPDHQLGRHFTRTVCSWSEPSSYRHCDHIPLLLSHLLVL